MQEVEKRQGKSIVEILREEFNANQRKSYKEIGKSLGVDRTTISDWVKRLIEIYENCHPICICPTCKKRYECQGFEKSHLKGYCTLACLDYQQSINS